MNRRDLLASSAAFLGANLIARAAGSMIVSKLNVPPEEDRHERTFMQWPVNRQVHPDILFLDLLQQTIADIANTIAEFEPVVLLAAKSQQAHARKFLSAGVELWDIPTEDLWCRDSGPLFAHLPDGQLVVSHIKFNGWGGKQIHEKDGNVAPMVAAKLGIPVIDSGLVGESGGVESDGNGLLMAHESSWFNKNRNPGLSLKEIERRLLAAYGAEKMIWAPGVRGEDITDYHIDSLARFTGPGRVLINLPDRPDNEDPFHTAALETHDRLVANGLDVEVIPEPWTRRVNNIDFVASYANYYVCNDAVIAAHFGDEETDYLAVEALKKSYPGREIRTLNVDALGEVGGGIHCATQQMPIS
ncbi:agmatine deiminase family protein [Sneathiella marina]|uniref:Agmatine deiminase family protein n=1 Tax=Sneathiella marina TaxID=2950108 RepID=A0ABY4W457_9PROT|nr:agmatine deiminase family protein [Sneathiella marina]USG61985.1 agmatine deiminase family protein [Sneathiella marina]